MKTITIKAWLALLLMFLIGAFGASLVFIEIPSGNKVVVIAIVTTLTSWLLTLINSLVRRSNE